MGTTQEHPLRPKGAVRVVGFARGTEAHKHILAPTIICEDEAGVQWEYVAAYATTDLDPYSPNQAESMRDWSQRLDKAIAAETYPWTLRSKITDGWLEQTYRAGKSVQQALKDLCSKA